MKVKELLEKVDLKVVAGNQDLDKEIKCGFVGDLLSVVMGKAEQGSVWVTIQGHINIVAVASLIEVACIIVAEGYEVESDAIEKANEEGVTILKSNDSSYKIVSKLYELGIH